MKLSTRFEIRDLMDEMYNVKLIHDQNKEMLEFVQERYPNDSKELKKYNDLTERAEIRYCDIKKSIMNLLNATKIED